MLGFEHSKYYFLRDGSQLFDTKPLIAVANGFAVPSEGPLRPSDLSGGQDHSARRLRELNFDVVSPAQLQPPRLGDEYESRTAIAAK
jgi:5-methylcytosine-specific restriction protein A